MNSSFSPFPQKILVAALSTALTMAFSPDVNAQSPIAMDGTTGAGAGANQDFSGIAGANQTVIIEGGGANANGSVKGANLFFSFDKLGVTQGDTAHIQCAGGQCGTGSAATSQANIANVITRVTGSNPSEINGTLKSTVGNANVWVFNPKGVAVGAGAQVDVPAALHISTANQLKDTNGNTMWAADDKNSTLTAGTPDTFGFDAASTGDINITDATISVGNGASEISSANNVDIINSQLPVQKANTSGTLNIAAQGKITVDAASELTADITAGTDINNSGIIHGNATTERINPQGQTVNINFDSELINTGHIDGDATVNIINNGIINGSTTATISGNGIVAGNTNASITNATSGSIQGNAKATTNIINNGIINGNAEATTGTLTNTNTVNGNALAGTNLINDVSSTIGKNATAKNGAITNRGTIGFTPPPIGITFNATAGTILNNSGTGVINGNAKANADIVNNGVITGDAEATTGTLTNSNIINGNAIAGTDLINNASGTIGKNTTANRKLNNSGTIQGNATTEYINPQGTTVNGDLNSELINTGTIEGNAAVNITNNGIITGSAIADVNTGISGGGTIKGIKTGRVINSNSGVIQGDAKATTDIVNSGIIVNNAYASTKLDNSGTIQGNAITERINAKNATVNGDFNSELINTGVIGGNALVRIINDGTINGSTTATISGSGTVNGGSNASITNSASAIINGNAKASTDINNSGIITGNAEATTGTLTNLNFIGNDATGASLDNKGVIRNNAIASTASLTNTNLITGNAIADGKLDNNGTIEKNAVVVNGQLLNKAAGIIKGSVSAKTDINNYGVIQGDTQAINGALTNYNAIAGNANAGADIINNAVGIIGKSATAGMTLDNKGIITGTAQANGAAVVAPRLINTGIIYSDAIASAGSLTNTNLIAGNAIASDKLDNSGTIANSAIVTNGQLLNQPAGIIKGSASAKTDINNYGIIQGNAEAITGTLANYQSIAGNAAAGTDIINNVGGTINNGAIAGVDLINYAVINGEAVYAGRDLINTGLTANINLNKSSGGVTAKRDLSVNDGSRIIFSNSGSALAIAGGAFTISNAANVTALNSGEFYALAGGNLTVNTAGKLTADNTGHYAATVGAGTALNNTGQLTATTTGGSLLVQQGGIIEKNMGAGDLTLIAHASSENGSAPNRQSAGGQVVVEDNGSAINVGINHAGNLIVYPDALVAAKNLNRNNQFTDATNKEQYALRVSDGGVINKNNSGNMEVTAQTVYLGGLNAIVGTTNGDINFNSVVKADAMNDARLPRYFKMKDATMTNVGAVNISDYFLNLDKSGIKSDTSITLNVFNSADIVYPKVLIGRNSSIIGLKTGKNFLDAPSNSKILINNRISLNPEDNIGTLTRDISAAMVVSNAIPELPDNPCDSHSQSTLNFKGVANYIPEVSSQVPYSVVTTATGAVSLTSTESTPLLPIEEPFECNQG
ncbi:MAG: hypothetical protein Q8Q54_09785 [Methylococcales bacterium]|nr:hypothetical protein [Methylococcales bacterium]